MIVAGSYRFMPQLVEQEEEGITTPILTIDNVTFTYIKHNNVYVVATSTKNANVTLILSFLHQAVQVSCGPHPLRTWTPSDAGP